MDLYYFGGSCLSSIEGNTGALVGNHTTQTLIPREQIIFFTIYYYWSVAALTIFCPFVLSLEGGHWLWIKINSLCPALHGAHIEKMHKVKQPVTRTKRIDQLHFFSKLKWVAHQSHIFLWSYRVTSTAVHDCSALLHLFEVCFQIHFFLNS